MEFMRYQPDRDGNWRAWLVTVAQREAWRLDGKERAHTGLDVGSGKDERGHEPVDPRDVVGVRSDLRFALEVFASIPDRRREVKALQVTGLNYGEIGERLGLSYTRVNRLVSEANEAISAERLRLRWDTPRPSARGERLRELEQQPPKWLIAAIGRPPGRHAPRIAALAWRRAAIAIDDYRREHGAHLTNQALGERPAEPRAARSFDLAQRAIATARDARQATRGQSLER